MFMIMVTTTVLITRCRAYMITVLPKNKNKWVEKTSDLYISLD